MKTPLAEITPRSPDAAPPGVTVVLPCLDEEASIAAVVEAARKGIARLGIAGEVLVVDNCCTDATAAVARQHGARVLVEAQRGYGHALRRGFEAAAHGILVMADGDLTYDLSRLDELVRPILAGEADFVLGNRLNAQNRGTMPVLHRYVGNPFLSLALRVLFRARGIRDAHCGLRAISRAGYERLGCVTTGMEFASEMIVRAIDARLRIAQRDIAYHPRLGASKLRPFRDGWRHLRFMLLHSPISLLLVPGAVLWLAGMALSIPLAFGPVVLGGRRFDIHFMMMGGLLSIVSIQFMTMGLLAKAYAHLSGLREDPFVAGLYRRLTFEKAILFALPLVLAGAYFCVDIVADWIAGGFGELDRARPLFFAVLCLVSGVQIATACYLFSVMALPRRLGESDRRG
ncbi:MAG: glycosyltransferase [Planctomycetota bacterium]